ncbi:MAG TPA: hypothetical protein VM925_09920 [Labilithrix sp.]|nr:hypothetical protein [Labilithrix sp.]
MAEDRAGDRPESRGHDAGRAALAGLEALATAVGIEVRIEPFELKMAGKGGLCRIHEQRVILVDAKLSILEQAGVIGEALGPEIPAHVAVPPALRPYLRTGHAKVGRLLRPRPLARGR